ASNAGLPRLVFLLDESADVPADLVDVDRAAVDRFRERLLAAGLLCATFATADGLELAAFHALVDLAGADARAVPPPLPAAAGRAVRGPGRRVGRSFGPAARPGRGGRHGGDLGDRRDCGGG